MKKAILLFFILIILLFNDSGIHAEILSHYINDNADVITPETEEYLEQALKELEYNTNGVQVIVYTENKIPDGTTLEENSLRIAEQNGIGNKEADNGILLYFVANDAQFRWEVGYGAESILNSAWLGRMSREEMIPRFKEGSFEDGIIYGLAEVEEKLLQANDPDIAVDPKTIGTDEDSNDSKQVNNNPWYTSWWFIALVIFIFVIIITLASNSSSRGSSSSGRYQNNDYFIRGAGNIFKGGFGKGGLGGGGRFGGGGFSGKF